MGAEVSEHSLSFSSLTCPSPSTNPAPSSSASSPLSARWRLQNCTITGLIRVTEDTIQLPQIWFPFNPADGSAPLPESALLHSLETLRNGHSPGPQEHSRKKLQLPVVAPWDKELWLPGTLHLQCGSEWRLWKTRLLRQQRMKEPESPWAALAKIHTGSGQKVFPSPQIVHF